MNIVFDIPVVHRKTPAACGKSSHWKTMFKKAPVNHS